MSKKNNRDVSATSDGEAVTRKPSRSATGKVQRGKPAKEFNSAERVSALEIAGYVGRLLAGKGLAQSN